MTRQKRRVALALLGWLAMAGSAGAGEVRLPDTGQTQSYTNTVGEDHDYRRPRSYTINTDGTVIDNVTGLMWQRDDDNTTRDWSAAGAYCDGLTLAGYTDWRLPSKKELQTLVSYDAANPAIDSNAFPGTEPSEYWSVTSAAYRSSYAWYVNFSYGYVNNYIKTVSSYYYVRCVRAPDSN